MSNIPALPWRTVVQRPHSEYFCFILDVDGMPVIGHDDKELLNFIVMCVNRTPSDEIEALQLSLGESRNALDRIIGTARAGIEKSDPIVAVTIITDAINNEREHCAKIAEAIATGHSGNGMAIADAIRNQ